MTCALHNTDSIVGTWDSAKDTHIGGIVLIHLACVGGHGLGMVGCLWLLLWLRLICWAPITASSIVILAGHFTSTGTTLEIVVIEILLFDSAGAEYNFSLGIRCRLNT